MTKGMKNEFGSRKTNKLVKSDIDAHNMLLDAIVYTIKQNGKRLGFKMPAKFPKPLEFTAIKALKYSDDSEDNENRQGYIIADRAMFLFKWSVKLLAAYESTHAWTYELDEMQIDSRPVIYARVFFTPDKRRVKVSRSSDVNAAISWILHTMTDISTGKTANHE